MEAKTLYSTILAKYSYEELKELCLKPDFRLLFDCDWGLWRDKAVTDFDISPQFFDLIRVLPAPQRYLQIASYVKLTPLSENVYEPLAGFREARFRKDKDMLLWFAQRITKEQEEQIKNIVPSYQTALIEHNNIISSWTEFEPVHPPKDGVYDVDYLCSVLERGRLNILDKIIHRYFTLPQGFSIEKHVPRIPFWQIRDEEGRDLTIMHNLPTQDFTRDNLEKLLRPILMSGDVRIVDFFRSIFRNQDFNTIIKEYYMSGSAYLFLHGRPEEAYGIDLRILNKQSYRGHGLCYDNMIESLLYALSCEEEKPEEYDFFTMRLGEVVYLYTLLSSVPQDKARINRLLRNQSFHVLYPLSCKILQEYVAKE
ncbi:Hypothetical protein BRZCDTV_327 [Brazilian cedratvirus IHUMI]|uniref:Uncharacterized protein n=1 Tax=Brazilian cedratvirus IHUMI TaxID=2126980 RepID=A0A2R8FEJ7_9VIRU|nr:Hypothetical protein BRZCDTV_327 [Brazilian cedratvirus IHUMI]